MGIRLKITKHAKLRMAEKAVNTQQVKEAIKRGSIIRQTDGFLAIYGYIEVAYKKIGEDYYKIKTVKIR